MNKPLTANEERLIDLAVQTTIDMITRRYEQGWYDQQQPSLFHVVNTTYHWLVRFNRGATNRMSKSRVKHAIYEKLEGQLSWLA